MIGRFSCLAVSDTVSIKSYYNKKLYSYVMYKDGDSLNIDLLNTTDTEYDNGVEIKVTVKNAYFKRWEIIEGLAELAYFEQIYINSNTGYLSEFVERFNRRTIHEFNNFKVCSLAELNGLYFLMGNVLYKNNDKNLIRFPNNPNIAVKCFIGEVDVTPNRENLRFNDRTKNVINYKLDCTSNEIYDKARELLNKDFATIRDWNYEINNGVLYVELWRFDNEVSIYANIDPKMLVIKHIYNNCTIRGKKIPKNLALHYNFITNMLTPYGFVTYDYGNAQFCKGKDMNLAKLIYGIKEGTIYSLKEPFKPLTKTYFREQFPFSRIRFIREGAYKSTYKELFGKYIKWLKAKNLVFSKEIFLLIAEEYYEAFKNIKSFNNSDVPKEWLDAHKSKKEQSKRRDFVIHTLYMGRQGVTTHSKKTFQDMMSEKVTIIYDEINSEYLRSIFKIFGSNGIDYNYTFIEVSKSNIPTLQKYKRFVHINDFTTKYNRTFSKIFTTVYIKLNCKSLKGLYYNYPSRDGYSHLLNVYNKYTNRYSALTNLCSTNNDLKELYEYYVSKKWLDYTIIDSINNPDVIKFTEFCNKFDFRLCHSEELANVAINYFVYKHNIKIGTLNKRNAYNILKTI